MMLAVPSHLIKSSRLRGRNSHPRDRNTEHEYEMMRVAEHRASYDAAVDYDRCDDDLL